MPETIDWPTPGKSRRPRLLVYLVIAVVLVIFIGSRTAVSYWVDLLWFGSLGYASVFWKSFSLEWGTFAAFAVLTFLILLGAFLALRHSHAADLPETHTIFFGGRPITLPVAKFLRIVAVVGALVVSLVTGFAMESQWPTLALYWYAPHGLQRRRSHLRPPARLLSLHAACVATHRRMAAHARGARLRSRRVLFLIAAGGGRALGGRFRHPPPCPGAASPSPPAFCCSRSPFASTSAASICSSSSTPSSMASPTLTRTSRSSACCSSAWRSPLAR